MSSATRLSQRVVPLFPLRMSDITANDQRLAEKNILGFLLGDLMLFPILLDIRFVPIEADALIQRILTHRHITSIR